MVIFLFKLVPKHGAQVVSKTPKNEVCNVPCGENTCVIKLHSGMDYNAVGHEFKVNTSIVYIINEDF